MARRLSTEEGASSNIKDRANRQSVQRALVKCQQKLKLYKKTPPNGLAIFCSDDISIDIEPPLPIKNSLYLCDKKFHPEYIEHLFETHKKYLILIVSGNGASFYIRQGTKLTKVGSVGVKLLTDTRKGGQSAARISRLREEVRHRYNMSISERTVALYVTHDVEGMIIGGASDWGKTIARELPAAIKVIKILSLGSEGDCALHETLEECDRGGVFDHSKKIEVERIEFFYRNLDTNMIVYGEPQIRHVLEQGLVKYLIIHEDYDGDISPEDVDITRISSATIQGKQILTGYGGIVGVLHFEYIVPNLEEETE